jgi:hypothetical protein
VFHQTDCKFNNLEIQLFVYKYYIKIYVNNVNVGALLLHNILQKILCNDKIDKDKKHATNNII